MKYCIKLTRMLEVFRYIILISSYFCITNGNVIRSSEVELFSTRGSSEENVEVIRGEVHDDSWTARGYFDNRINSTGFGYLEVETNMRFDSKLQAYHAGYLEGFLTADLIYSRYFNTILPLCKKDIEECDKIDRFVKKNSKWISKQIKYKNDPYWYQIQLFYLQVNGLYHGYNANTKFEKLDWSDILWLNLVEELGDIQKMSSPTSAPLADLDNDHCSALVKIMPGSSDIYFAHNTWNQYAEMLRILKKYILRYKQSPTDETIIPGFELSTSSYPGALISIDDYYLIGSGLAVMETTNEVYNKTIFKGAKPQGIVWEGVRSMIANRLAIDGKSWHEIVKLYNSGTYNNQWMVFDFKKFKPGRKLVPDTLVVGEQLPNFYIFNDVTDILNENGYWASYNIPYFREVFKMSGYDDALNENGTWFSYTEAPRPKIFARDQVKVKDMTSFMRLMRSNDFKKEPFAVCNCTPPYAASGAIAARKDLNPADGHGLQIRKPYGAIDAKLTNYNLFKELKFTAVAGPTSGTHQTLPVFKWSESPFPDTPHMSHPDVFDFAPVTKEWLLVEDNSISVN